MKKLKANWLFILFSKPQYYLYKLVANTLIVGFISLIMILFYIHEGFTSKIPPNTYTLFSIAIGMLLVYRTSSAYERWSTANKNFYDIQSNFYSFVNKTTSLLSKIKDKSKKENQIQQFKTIIFNICHELRVYLSTDDEELAAVSEEKYLSYFNELSLLVENLSELSTSIEKGDLNYLHKLQAETMNSIFSCSRIKNTPIPVSYSLHIKVSLILYIMSLPFGLFVDLGLYGCVIVMFAYYILAGIELISKEIENPFYGDPNDLPIDEYFQSIKRNTEKFLY